MSSSTLPSSPLPLNTGTISDDHCDICNLLVADNDKALICDKCEKWIHAKCTKMSDIRYEHHEVNPEDIFVCRNCRTCGICDKIIALNHKFIECSSCMSYVHIKCNKFDAKQYDRHLEDENPTFCFRCNRENLPFLDLNDKQHG